MKQKKRLGLYAWGGPGTVDLLRVKYRGWGMDIDEGSFLSVYDRAFLHKAHAMGVTDMWVTYSWGFGDAREHDHREFLRKRLPLFRERGIRTHAYVQGPNLVTADFKGRDVFCRNPRGRLIPYSAGRSMICLHNPEARGILLSRVAAACSEDVDGVFMDNIVFGAPPNCATRDFAPFFGCACGYCRAAFKEAYGYRMPAFARRGEEEVGDCLKLRCRATERLLADCAGICRAAGKQFGVNLYDPVWHVPEFFFGYSLSAVLPHLSYLLIENHALTGDGVNNSHLRTVIAAAGKPTFIVSYRKGIGCDAQWSQKQVDAIASEAAALGYHPCLKASEFVERKTWHALRIAEWRKPRVHAWKPAEPAFSTAPLPESTRLGRLRSRALAALQLRLSRWFFEARLPSWVDRKSVFARVCRTARPFSVSGSFLTEPPDRGRTRAPG